MTDAEVMLRMIWECEMGRSTGDEAHGHGHGHGHEWGIIVMDVARPQPAGCILQAAWASEGWVVLGPGSR